MESVADFGTKPHLSCEPANEQKGCYDYFQDEIQDNKLYVGLGVAGILLMQVIEIICAIIIFKEEKAKVSPF
ncbi:hypothetical protein ElyMa_002637300 [Elysia marginata]|uniref:Uncharacterized protein n=1 Tax=Elysia marginata TaxID=1093978 RepID=A0AAV4H638_9GAST|nr:hypothetical protein ElyMa_002637300 [Elysia marginata]